MRDFNIYLTHPRAQIMDLDGLLMMDRSMVNYEKYNQYIGQALVKHSISFQATRGCPYKCLYCHKIWPKKHVARSAANLFEEMKLYYDLGVRRFSFVDDIFNRDTINSMNFFQLIIKNGLKVHLLFSAGLRGDIMTEGYIDLMIEAGTINCALSLETASPRLQKLVEKYLNIEKLRQNIEYICGKYPGFILELFTMHGFPTETEDEAMMTLDFIKSMKWLHFPYISILRIYPNTDMEKLAIKHGIPGEAIVRSQELPFHELPETLPFDKSFTFNYQAEFLHGYFLLKESLLKVLPYQMKVLTEDELVQKYNSYLPGKIGSLDDILNVAGISRNELEVEQCLDEANVKIPDLNKKLRDIFPSQKPRKDALRVLLLDLSLYFSGRKEMLYDCIDPPLGLICLMSYLNQQLGSKVCGKIAKARLDFDSYEELKLLLEEFNPDVIGIRTLTLFKNFFHQAVAMIRWWGVDVPIITGGPYATSDYERVLQDRNIDLTVIGEGEVTFYELIKNMIENNKELPDEETLKEIPGIAFVPGRLKEKFESNESSSLLEVNLSKALQETLISQFNDELEDE